jgi:hypothetical protein
MAEVKSHFSDLFPVHCAFAIGCNVGQYPPVLPENIIDVSHKVIVVAVEPVVVTVATLIRAEFFIGAAVQRFTAVHAVTFH